VEAVFRVPVCSWGIIPFNQVMFSWPSSLAMEDIEPVCRKAWPEPRLWITVSAKQHRFSDCISMLKKPVPTLPMAKAMRIDE
jgi:hypothetical protein